MPNRPRITWKHVAPCVALLASTVPSGATAGTSAGSAETANTVLSLTVAGTEIVVGADAAEAERGDSLYARAAFTAGRGDETTTGQLERTGTSSADSGSDDLVDGDLTLPGLLHLTVVEASASIGVDDARVSSSADSTLAGVDLFDGLVVLDGLASSASAEVTDTASEASRTITLDGLRVFDLAGLLEAIGVDALAVPCEGIEGAAAALGVDADQTCEQLAAADDALADARAGLDHIADELDLMTTGYDRADVEADRATAAALSCAPLDLLCVADALATLTVLATTYDVTLTDPTDLTITKAEVVAALDELLAAFDDRAVIAEAIDAAGTGTCDATADALTAAEAGLSEQDPAGAAPELAALRSEAEAACATLRATTGEVMATPVVTMDDVTITLTARAAEGDTVGGVTVSIGAVRIGVNEQITVADLADGLAKADALAEAIAAVVDGLMLDAPTPEIELFAVDGSDGQAENGAWFADASLAVLQITQPAGPVTVPDEPPFALLGDGATPQGTGGGGIGLGAAPRALLAAVVDSPEVVVRAVVFDAAAGFVPASSDGGDGGDDGGGGGNAGPGASGGDGSAGHGSGLPVTGDADDLFTFVASLLLLAAGGIRRWLARA